ncbi:hypothetical protein N9242_04850 [Vicingaceae bacterium]|nr:hypothetical protein [Vicingaceae bacterium]
MLLRRNKLFRQFLFLIFFTSYLLTSAQDSTYTKKWDDDTKKFEQIFKNGNKDGIWREWNNQKELVKEIIYENDSIVSTTEIEYYSHTKGLIYESIKYNSDEIIIEKRVYQSNDSKSYALSSFYKNGKLKSKGRITLDNKIGNWSYYNDKGELIEIKKHISQKVKTPKQKSRQITKTNKNYKKGHYVTSTDKKVFGYFDKNGHSKLLFKTKPEDKGKLLILSDINKITIGSENFTVIDSIILKLCGPFNQIRPNIIAKNRVQGDINLYSISFVCNSGGGMMIGTNGMMSPTQTGVSIDREVFIVRKLGTKEYIKVKKRRKLFRELIKELMKDKPKAMAEINVEKIDYKNLIHILQKYNSSIE